MANKSFLFNRMDEGVKGASFLAYLFWMVLGFVLGCVLAGKYVCKYWCGCG